MAIAHDSYQKVANKVRQKACWRRKLMALRAKIPIFLQQLILSTGHAPPFFIFLSIVCLTLIKKALVEIIWYIVYLCLYLPRLKYRQTERTIYINQTYHYFLNDKQTIYCPARAVHEPGRGYECGTCNTGAGAASSH